MKTTNFYLEQNALFPLQIVAEASPDLQLVIVIPCRAQEEVRTTLDSLAACADCCKHAEVILVIYSEADDGDEILQSNTRIFRDTDQWSRNGGSALRLFLLDFHHLPADTSTRNTALKIGLDEGVQRLEDARNPMGLLMVLEPGSIILGGTAKPLMASAGATPGNGGFQLLFSTVGGNQETAHSEALLRYLRMGITLSGYPLVIPVPDSAIALRSLVYQKVGGLQVDSEQPLSTLAHHAALEMPINAVKGGGIKIPETQILACLPSASDLVPHVQSFMDLRALLHASAHLFEATSPNAFNRLAAHLPQPVLAYLMENDGYHLLQSLRKGCANASQFERQLKGWLEPGRVWDLVMQSGEHFNGMVPLAEAIESILVFQVGEMLPVLSDDYLLSKCRQWEMQATAQYGTATMSA